MARKFRQCEWCSKTMDVTNNDNDLCSKCAKFPSKMEIEKSELKCPLNFYF